MLLGGGGEFYRTILKITKIFIQVFNKNINPKKIFLKKENFKKCINIRNNKKMTKYDLHKFYTNFRYPRNTNRRNNYLKNYIFPIIFVDEQLYKSSKTIIRRKIFSKILK